jgi:hypothetical protein
LRRNKLAATKPHAVEGGHAAGDLDAVELDHTAGQPGTNELHLDV